MGLVKIQPTIYIWEIIFLFGPEATLGGPGKNKICHPPYFRLGCEFYSLRHLGTIL